MIFELKINTFLSRNYSEIVLLIFWLNLDPAKRTVQDPTGKHPTIRIYSCGIGRQELADVLLKQTCQQ